MTVQDLIEILEQVDPTATVVLASDPEGNSYAPLEDYAIGAFDSKESVFVRDDDIEDYYVEHDDEEREEPNGTHAIALWPAY